MAKRTRWTCDGCDVEATTKHEFLPPDWHTITVKLDGFDGHPVGARANGRYSYDLCTQCTIEIRDKASPRNWDRPDREEITIDELGRANPNGVICDRCGKWIGWGHNHFCDVVEATDGLGNKVDKYGNVENFKAGTPGEVAAAHDAVAKLSGTDCEMCNAWIPTGAERDCSLVDCPYRRHLDFPERVKAAIEAGTTDPELTAAAPGPKLDIVINPQKTAKGTPTKTPDASTET